MGRHEDLPFVSVITPCYNAVASIEATILSVLEQEYPGVQHIVVDGRSTDGTVDILRRHSHLDWTSEPDDGQADAINKGFRRARGDIIAWLNADDLYLPGTLEFVGRFFREHPEVDLLYGEVDWIDEGGGFVCHVPSQPFDPAAALVENPIGQPAAFFRCRVLERAGYLRADYDYLMDYEFWWRIYRQCHIRFVPRTLAAFRISEHTKTGAHLEGFHLEHLRILREILEDEWHAVEVGHARDRAFRRIYWYAGLALYRAGRNSDGWDHCATALTRYGLLEHDRRYAVKAAAYVPFYHSCPPWSRAWFEPLLADIAASDACESRFIAQIHAHLLATRGFYYFDVHRDRRQARVDLWRALWHDARWRRNRGFWRRLAESTVPQALHPLMESAVRPFSGRQVDAVHPTIHLGHQ